MKREAKQIAADRLSKRAPEAAAKADADTDGKTSWDEWATYLKGLDADGLGTFIMELRKSLE